ncbi:MAG: hypothetical protein KAV42_07460 [Candidatus Krumholzibacteria bacterium]|nr:hypothetical protein [Candidatus Krumholzibacteria bacterium]
MNDLNDREEILSVILESDRRYAREAYVFVLGVIDVVLSELKEKRHISGLELLEGLRMQAMRQFGPMAKQVFNEWGLIDTSDIGHVVFNLVEEKMLEKTDDDNMDDFTGVFDFKKVFEEDYFGGG